MFDIQLSLASSCDVDLTVTCDCLAPAELLPLGRVLQKLAVFSLFKIQSFVQIDNHCDASVSTFQNNLSSDVLVATQTIMFL